MNNAYFLGMYISLSLMFSIIPFFLNEDKGPYVGCPKYIYKHSKLNVFGVSLLFLFFLMMVVLTGMR